MKSTVIGVVSFFMWLVVLISIAIGWSGWGIIGAVGGFLIGCSFTGLWFLLVSINENLEKLVLLNRSTT